MPKLLGRKHADIDASYGLEKKGNFYVRRKTFSECFLVVADNINQYEDDIVSTPGLPQRGDFLDGGWLITKTAKEIASVIHPTSGVWTTLWEVEAQYDSNVSQDEISNEDDPTNLRPKRRWYAQQEEEPLIVDAVTGMPIETQAGEPIGVMVPVGRPILEIQRYEPYPFDPNIFLTYANHVNEKPFYGAKQGCVLMMTPEAEEVTINNEVYIQVTYTFKFRIDRMKVDREYRSAFKTKDIITINGEDFYDVANSYALELLHEGYQYLPNAKVIETVIGPITETEIDPTDPEPHPIINTDANGNPVKIKLFTDPDGPRLRFSLGRGGTRLTQEDLDANNQQAHYLVFNQFPYADFTPLGLEF